jgi:hypothetical protein
MINMDGAKANTVKINITLMTVAMRSGSPDSPILIVTVGMGTILPCPWAIAKEPVKTITVKRTRKDIKPHRIIGEPNKSAFVFGFMLLVYTILS